MAEFRGRPEVWHINGNNFACPPGYFGDKTIAFASLPQVWGWATWRDRWRHYVHNPLYLAEKTGEAWKEWRLSPPARVVKRSHMDKLKRGFNTWDYQWHVTVLNARGLCVVSRSNLISNIGDGYDATHTKRRDSRMHLPMQALAKPPKRPKVVLNSQIARFFEKNMGLDLSPRYFLDRAYHHSLNSKYAARKVACRLLHSNAVPIIVSSTGRCGSSLLCRAIAEGYVRDKYNLRPSSFLELLLSRIARGHLARVADMRKLGAVVMKTHDLFDPKYETAAKYVFIYGDPYYAARSVEAMVHRMGYSWFEAHQYHLRGQGSFEDLFQEDVLNYEAQIRSWLRPRRDTVFTVRYSDLWERVDEISEYLGFNISLPEKRPRSLAPKSSHCNKEMFERLASLPRR